MVDVIRAHRDVELEGGEAKERIARIVSRHPMVGFAVGVVTPGSHSFHCHGYADIRSATPVTENTVFRIGSITKTMTAIAVMQLWERGAVDLTAPVDEYLKAFDLVAVDPTWRRPNLVDLLTHTAGIPDVPHVRDLLHPTWGRLDSRPPLSSVEPGAELPTLTEYYRKGLEIVSAPGTEFAYSNHGYAALGQVVEDVVGVPLGDYVPEQLFEPLGMRQSSMASSAHRATGRATGYVFEAEGPKEVRDRDWIGIGAGGVSSSSRDLALYLQGLLKGLTDDETTVLHPDTIRKMFEPRYQTDHRLPGMALGFLTTTIGGHRVVGHDGILPGFNSSVLLAPDDGLAVFGLTNGAGGAMTWLPLEMHGLLAQLLGASDESPAQPAPQHPEIWHSICGTYHLPQVGDLRGRLMLGGGARVMVSHGRLGIRLLTPLPNLRETLPLVTADPTDPLVFRLGLDRFDLPPVTLVFDIGGPRKTMHTDLGGQPISLYARPPRESRLNRPRGGTACR